MTDLSVSEIKLKLHEVYDPALIINFAERLLRPSSRLSAIRTLGQGQHVEAYPLTLGKLECIVKIPRALRDEAFENPFTDDWANRVHLASSENVTFFPPIILTPFRDTYLQFMPRVELIQNTSKAERISNESQFQRSLANHGLKHNDTLQLGVFQGMTVAVDVSAIDNL